MIAIIDPAFFSERIDEKTFKRDLQNMLIVLNKSKSRLVYIDAYWKPLWEELIGPLQSRYPSTARELTELRKIGFRSIPQTISAYVWGFKAFFDAKLTGLNPEWVDRMTQVVLNASMQDEKVIIYVGKKIGRNIKRHQVENVIIDEPTRWRLYIQVKGIKSPGPKPISCIYNYRHISHPWTARYSWRLPAISDGGKFPFLPSRLWWRRDTVVVRTIESKPAFVDDSGRGWSSPNTPGLAYHWDVSIHQLDEVKKIGVDHINVVAYGVPSREGIPGDIHHIPDDLKSLINNPNGWM
jgi:hypothetical protein